MALLLFYLVTTNLTGTALRIIDNMNPHESYQISRELKV